MGPRCSCTCRGTGGETGGRQLPPYRLRESPRPAGLPFGWNSALSTSQRARARFPFAAGGQQRDYLRQFTVRENEACRACGPISG